MTWFNGTTERSGTGSFTKEMLVTAVAAGPNDTTVSGGTYSMSDMVAAVAMLMAVEAGFYETTASGAWLDETTAEGFDEATKSRISLHACQVLLLAI